MKKVIAILAIGLGALGLGACGGTKAAAPSAKAVAPHTKVYVAPVTVALATTAASSTTVAPVLKSDAVTIAKRLGCVNPVNDPSNQMVIPGFTNPTQVVECTVNGTDIEVDVYAAPSDLAKVYSPAGRVVICSLVTAFGATGPFYSVMGSDFDVSATSPVTSGDTTTQVGTLAQAQALGTALGLPVTTVTC